MVILVTMKRFLDRHFVPFPSTPLRVTVYDNCIQITYNTSTTFSSLIPREPFIRIVESAILFCFKNSTASSLVANVFEFAFFPAAINNGPTKIAFEIFFCFSRSTIASCSFSLSEP